MMRGNVTPLERVKLAALLAPLLLAVPSGHAQLNKITSGGTTPFAVSNSDLLQPDPGAAPIVTGEFAGFGTGGEVVLPDGSDGGTPGTNFSTTATVGAGSTVTDALNIGVNPPGYTITQINNFGAWDEGRDAQNLNILSSTIFDPTSFVALATVSFEPPFPETFSRVSVNPALGDPFLATDVHSIRFAFPAQEAGAGGCRELDVIGTTVLNPAVCGWLFGAAALTPCFGRRRFRMTLPSAQRCLRPISVAAVVAALMGTAAAQNFRVTSLLDFGSELGSGNLVPAGVNDRGDVAATGFLNEGSRAFLFRDGELVNLGTLGGASSVAVALNNAGEVAGVSTTASSTLFNHAFRFANGSMSDLGTLGGSGVFIGEINSAGQIAGTALNAAGQVRAFVSDGNSLTTLLDQRSTGSAINDAGDIVGSVALTPGIDQAYVFQDGVLTPLGFFGGSESRALDINNSGQIAGTFFQSTTATSFGFLREPDGTVVNLGAFFEPIDFNDRGHILGNGGRVHFGAQTTTIDALAAEFLVPDDGLTVGFSSLGSVRAMSNNFIVGQGNYFNGQFFEARAFRLEFTSDLGFVWEGAEGFAFRTAGNWSDGATPGPTDTVQLTFAGQLKTIEFAVGDLVTTRRLLAASDSATEVDLNGGVWRVDAAGNPTPTGQFRLVGANLTVRDGTVEVFGRAVVANDGGFNNLLALEEGGRFIVRDDDLVVGTGGGLRDTFLSVTGENSLLEARDLVLGAGNGVVTALVEAGASAFVGRELRIGSNGEAGLGLIGAEGTGPTFLQVAEGGQVRIGGGAVGLLSISGGASAIFSDVDVTIGNQGRISLSGESSRLNGGRFTVEAGGELVLADAANILESVSVTGGATFLRQGAIVRTGPLAVAGGGGLTIESGANAIAAKLDVASVNGPDGATGFVRVEGGSTLRVEGAALIGGAAGGSGLLEITGASSRLTAEAGLAVGGVFGAGRFLVEDGATATVAEGLVLFAPTAEDEDSPRSEVRLRGAGSTLNTNRLLLVNAASVNVEAGTTLEVTGETSVGSGGLTVFGTASLGAVTMAADGSVFALLGTDARATASSITMNGGILAVDAGAALTVPTFTLNGGLLNGRGRIVGNVIQNGGEILPGQSPGTLTIDGDFTQTGGRIVLEIGGLTPGAQHDQLIVGGNFSLTGGTIEFAFVDGFAPSAGQEFTFFGVTGAFDSDAAFAVSGLKDGWEFATAFDPDTGTFGLTSLTDAITIPEPGILALLALAAAGLLANHRRKALR